MYRLQERLRAKTPSTPERENEIRLLREEIPAQLLGHFDRLIKQRGAAVAMVRHGVCGECHLRIPRGTLAGLALPKDLHLCDNCGCYLLLAENEAPPSLVIAAAALADEIAAAAPRPSRRRARSVGV